jgi:hypothetical protein
MDKRQAILQSFIFFWGGGGGATALRSFNGTPRMPMYREEQVQFSVLTGLLWFSSFMPGKYFTVSYNIYYRLLFVPFRSAPLHVAILQNKLTYVVG